MFLDSTLSSIGLYLSESREGRQAEEGTEVPTETQKGKKTCVWLLLWVPLWLVQNSLPCLPDQQLLFVRLRRGCGYSKASKPGCLKIWKFDTLWEHPLEKVNRHVIHHGCIVYAQKICGRLLQEFIASWKIGREQSTYCGRNLVCDQPVLQYSIGLRTHHFWHQDDVIDQVNTVIVVYWSVLHLILDSTWVWYSLLLELKIPTLVWHWDYFLCPRHSWTLNTEKFILSKWWEHS